MVSAVISGGVLLQDVPRHAAARDANRQVRVGERIKNSICEEDIVKEISVFSGFA